MKIEGLVLVGDKNGKIAWIDNPWFHKDGTPVDLLCKITFESDNFKWHRISELKPITEDIKENKIENIEKKKNRILRISRDRKKLEIKIGKVTGTEDVPKSNKLIKLTVDFGSETRTVVTNIKPTRNSISAEFISLAYLNSHSGKLLGAIKHLDKFLKDAESDFTTKDELASSISSSQPYNYGSRENY